MATTTKQKTAQKEQRKYVNIYIHTNFVKRKELLTAPQLHARSPG